MKNALLIASMSLIAIYLPNANAHQKVIYGQDDRREYYEISNAKIKQIADATLAMVAPINLKEFSQNEVHLSGSTLQAQGMCSTERFANQITAANCSGFLITPTTLVTAGHCIQSESDCGHYRWVKNFKMTYPDQNNFALSSQDVFHCKRIIKRDLNNIDKNDFAVLELDRPVNGVVPLKTRKSGKIKKGESLVVLGHPSGLPLKIAGGASVRDIKDKFFVANLDTYGGNSGSAVINAKTLLVEGILVRGDQDYDYVLGCMSSHLNANDAGRGEDVTKILNIKLNK
jgi:V8-like Glu-specific endopeptidase